MKPQSNRISDWLAGKSTTTNTGRPVFFIHIMRTAGTSFREMLEEHFGPTGVYPKEEAIKRRGRYPNLTELLDERSQVLASSLVFGHYPFVLRSLWPEPPCTVTLLRDPVERTISIMKFARLRRPQFEPSTPLAQVFDDDEFRAAMIQNYQTKVFAIPRLDDAHGVNVPLPDRSVSVELAKERLEACDTVGLTGRFADSVDAFQRSTNIELTQRVHTNQSRSEETINETLRTRIAETTALDAELVDYAHGILDRQLGNSVR